MTKRLILGAALALLVAGPALAADLPTKAVAYAPPPGAIANWSGWSAGLFGGWGQSTEKTTIKSIGDPLANVASQTGIVPGTQDPRPDGGFFGGELRWGGQNGVFTYGVGFDARWTGIDGKASQTLNFLPLAALETRTTSSMNWMATVTGDVGILFNDRLRWFVKGGVAWADLEHTTTVALTSPIAALNASQTSKTSGVETGWIVGTGIEALVGGGWFAKLEYEYASFGGRSHAGSVPLLGFNPGWTSSDDANFHFVKGGVFYRFNL